MYYYIKIQYIPKFNRKEKPFEIDSKTFDLDLTNIKYILSLNLYDSTQIDRSDKLNHWATSNDYQNLCKKIGKIELGRPPWDIDKMSEAYLLDPFYFRSMFDNEIYWYENKENVRNLAKVLQSRWSAELTTPMIFDYIGDYNSFKIAHI